MNLNGLILSEGCRWFELSSFIDCLRKVDIRSHYQLGKEKRDIVDDADDLRLLLNRLSKPNAKIRGVYTENIYESQINGMVKENYFEIYH